MMQAITLWQPWASLIAHGVKNLETRDWYPPRALIGQRIAIHAAKKFTRQMVDDIVGDEYVMRKEADLNWQPTHPSDFSPLHLATLRCGYNPLDLLPRGCVVATAILAGYAPTDSDKVRDYLRDHPDERHYGDFSRGRFAWRLIQVERLAVPIPATGMQGFWQWDAPDEMEIAA